MRRKTICISLLILVSFAVSPFSNALANGKDRLTVDLYMDWESVAAPQISPDGNQIVYTRRWTDKINDKYECSCATELPNHSARASCRSKMDRPAARH